jgi:SAM-dependent methyltransferase
MDKRGAAAAGWHPHGLAIRDYLAGDRAAAVTAHRSDGLRYDIPAAVFFRAPGRFDPLERAALARCRGRVLDAGAGAGCHSLALQARGLSVCALDVAPQAVAAMRRRGVQEAVRGDVLRYRGGPFDTLLLLMNGIALVKSLPGLARFLKRARRLVRPGGQVLLDSLDLRRDDWSRAEALRRRRTGRRYFGVLGFRLEYRGRLGPGFHLLFIDPATLARHAARAGWDCQVIKTGAQGRFLARLTPKPIQTRAARAPR